MSITQASFDIAREFIDICGTIPANKTSRYRFTFQGTKVSLRCYSLSGEAEYTIREDAQETEQPEFESRWRAKLAQLPEEFRK